MDATGPRRQRVTRRPPVRLPPAADALPALGEWDGPIYGALGVLAQEDDTLQCHICGRWFRSLGGHAALAHRVSADEYRALFGLRTSTALAGAALRASRREKNATALRPYHGQARGVAQAMTLEERRAYNLGRRQRLEALRDPANQRRWQELGQRGRDELHALRRDPQHGQEFAERLSRAHGGRVVVPCVVCGTPIAAPRSVVRRRQRATCSEPCKQELARRRTQPTTVSCAVCARPISLTPWRASRARQHACGEACARELHRRRLAADHPMHRPGARAKVSDAVRSRLPEMRAKIAETFRHRGRRERDRLRALPATAFEALPERTRVAVALYYGLAGEGPCAQREIAARLGTGQQQVSRLLRQAVALLLPRRDSSPGA